MKLFLEKGARDEKGLMVFSPSIRQFFFFFFFFFSFLGRGERWRCCRAVCVHKRSLPFSASFVSFVCFVLFCFGCCTLQLLLLHTYATTDENLLTYAATTDEIFFY